MSLWLAWATQRVLSQSGLEGEAQSKIFKVYTIKFSEILFKEPPNLKNENLMK